MKSPRTEAEIKHIFSEFRKRNRSDGEMEIAPLRGIDDFILTKSRFQVRQDSYNDTYQAFEHTHSLIIFSQRAKRVSLSRFHK